MSDELLTWRCIRCSRQEQAPPGQEAGQDDWAPVRLKEYPGRWMLCLDCADAIFDSEP